MKEKDEGVILARRVKELSLSAEEIRATVLREMEEEARDAAVLLAKSKYRMARRRPGVIRRAARAIRSMILTLTKKGELL